MSTHSKLSPSSRHRWALCPGSVREETKYPDNAGAAALDGTRSHALLEFCLKTKADPIGFIGTTVSLGDDSFTVDRERAERVAVAWNYVQGRPYEVETRVNPAKILGRDDLSGTVDIIVDDGEVLEIIDFKDGINPVIAEGNHQMEQYAYGVLAERDVTAHVIRMTIIQPKLALRGLPVIDSHEVDRDEFLSRKNIIIAQAAATDDPAALLIPGESQCKYCKAKGSCTALVNKSLSAIDLSTSDLIQSSADKDPVTMDNEQLAKVLEAAPLVKAMIAAAEEEVMKWLQNGEAVKGFKLVNGRGSRAWALPDDQIADRLQKMGVPKSSVYKTEVVSVAQAEKLVWVKKKNGEDVKQGLTPRQIKTMQEEYVVTKAGKLTVVPESDPRKAVTTDVSSLFNEVLPKWLIGE